MYRHYQGNSGKSRRVEEPEKSRGQFHGRTLAPVPEKKAERREVTKQQTGKKTKTQPQPKEKRDYEAPPSPLSGLSGEFGKFFGKLGSLSLETEDLLLIAVLYLMYRESGDKELLIMIGALLFL